MSKFQVGDIVERVVGNHAGMRRDDSGRVLSASGDGITLEGWKGIHNAGNFRLVIDGSPRVPIGDPDDSPVKHPKHYNSHPSGVECITIARHHNFNIGNAFKYLWRIGLKGAKAATKEKRIQEIDKAIFYLNDERARIEAEE